MKNKVADVNSAYCFKRKYVNKEKKAEFKPLKLGIY